MENILDSPAHTRDLPGEVRVWIRVKAEHGESKTHFRLRAHASAQQMAKVQKRRRRRHSALCGGHLHRVGGRVPVIRHALS